MGSQVEYQSDDADTASHSSGVSTTFPAAAAGAHATRGRLFLSEQHHTAHGAAAGCTVDEPASLAHLSAPVSHAVAEEGVMGTVDDVEALPTDG